MSSLYQIDNAILECLDLETGEILDFERLGELRMEREKKIENVALWIKNLESEAAAIKAEQDTLAARRKVKENRVKSLKEYLSNSLNGQEFESAKVQIRYRKSSALEISDADTLLDWLEKNEKESCIKYKAPEISASEVTKLIKAGEEVPGAVLVERQNLLLK